MNLHERFSVWMLTAFDRLMNRVTFGLWEQVRGDVTWTNIKVNEE